MARQTFCIENTRTFNSTGRLRRRQAGCSSQIGRKSLKPLINTLKRFFELDHHRVMELNNQPLLRPWPGRCSVNSRACVDIELEIVALGDDVHVIPLALDVDQAHF